MFLSKTFFPALKSPFFALRQVLGRPQPRATHTLVEIVGIARDRVVELHHGLAMAGATATEKIWEFFTAQAMENMWTKYVI